MLWIGKRKAEQLNFSFFFVLSKQNEFVSAFQSFSTSVKGFGLSDTEVGLFSALVLLTPQRPGITEHKQISRIREKIAEALRVQIVRSRPGSTASLQLMPALEAKIPELRGRLNGAF